MSASGFDGINLFGRWECGACGASGDGWWDEENGFTADVEHECQETSR